jgi:hypothetical protein
VSGEGEGEGEGVGDGPAGGLGFGLVAGLGLAPKGLPGWPGPGVGETPVVTLLCPLPLLPQPMMSPPATVNVKTPIAAILLSCRILCPCLSP